MSAEDLKQAATFSDHLERLPLRERKKRRTRMALQNQALRLFSEQGYEATTMEQIAAAAEVSASTAFRYFPTKEDLVIQDEYDPFMLELFRAQPPELSPIEALRSMFGEALPHLYERDRAQLTARIQLMATVPSIKSRFFNAMRGNTLAVIDQVIAERVGRDPKDPEVECFAWAVTGSLYAAMFSWLESDGELELPELVDRNLKFLAAGCPLGA
ncbi:TetR family transcriptional regulator [Actinomadura meridiana]|uniref:TetR family transcriptional regulator n=1 Tax=Actinomadura meridiana TaxID=559626 RepID=A0ABP8C2H4_9ACTN